MPVLHTKDRDYRSKISNDYDIKHSSESKLSCFERILCLYTTTIENDKLGIKNPLSYIDKQNSTIGRNLQDFYATAWEHAVPISSLYNKANNTIKMFEVSGKHVSNFTGLSPQIDVLVIELVKKGETQTRGLVCTIEKDNTGISEFSEWFMYHLLEVSKMEYFQPTKEILPNSYHRDVAKYFNHHLKNHVLHDLWDAEGQHAFMEKLKYFTERMLPIQAILPAFPCKSTNLQKVSGVKPDLGEALALKTLINFCRDIKKHCYTPGFKIWIVSDGHVFSDCIGADDDTVDNFTIQLNSLYKKIKLEYGKEDSDYINDSIRFFGLKDIFYSENSGALFDEAWLASVHLEHYTVSKIEKESEICRKIMIAACDSDNGRLSEQVRIHNHPRLFLYRGFTKFMEEDISKLGFVSNLSRKQQKKLAAKIAFEMIKRNDAYSNLVDLCFPHHMRLSIHAHPNSGPKYGIKVVAPEICKVIKSFTDLTYPNYEDFLHIPTPWHNVVIHNLDNDRFYFGRSSIVAEAIQSKCFMGKMNDDGNGSVYYELRTRDESDKCEFDDYFNVDDILSKLRLDFVHYKKRQEWNKKAASLPIKSSNYRSESFMNACELDTSIRRSLDKSNTMVFEEGSSSISQTDSNNMTPIVTEMEDGGLEQKLERDLEMLNMEAEKN